MEAKILEMKAIFKTTPAAELQGPLETYQKISEQVDDDIKDAIRRKPKPPKKEGAPSGSKRAKKAQ